MQVESGGTKSPSESRWYNCRGDAAAATVVGICDALQRDSDHRERWFAARTLYESRLIVDETMRTHGLNSSAEMYNLTRSAVDTAQAEIAARQRPKPMFLTSGAEWKLKRKAKKLDRFVEGWFSQRQGERYADVWEVGEDVFRDACLAVGGVIKVVPDTAKKRIKYDRIPAYEVLIDPYEARGGDPQNWFHVYEMDADVAIATFTEGIDDKGEIARIREAIESSEATRETAGGDWRATRSVSIYEAWRLPFSKDKPGRHLFATKNGCLHEEDWEWPRPPFAVLAFSKEPFGIWGVGLAESGAKQHEVVNDLAERVHARFRLNAHRRTYVQPGTVNMEAMKRNDPEVFIECKDIAIRPQSEQIPPVTAAETAFVETEIGRYYEILGVPQMNAQSRKEPGVDAAVAMQTLNDIKGVRFMPKARAYELLYVELGELTVLAARDLAADDPNFAVKWPDKRFLQSINWRDVDLAADMYEVRVAPVSAMSRDPAQRLQIVEQLTNMGFLTRERYLDLIGLPDLESVLQLEGSEQRWLERIIDRYLDADDDDELDEMGGFVEPEGFLLNKQGAMVLSAQHYFEARLNDAPEYQCDLLRRFMGSLGRLLAPPPSPTAPMVQGQPAAVLPAAPSAMPQAA